MKSLLILFLTNLIFNLTLLEANSQQYQIKDLASQCDKGKIESCNKLGILHESNGDHRMAAKLFGKACDDGLAVACSNLGEKYFDGLGVEQNMKRSSELFIYGCENNVVSGCAGVCLILAWHGKLTMDNRPNCETALKIACENGNPWMCDKRLNYADKNSGKSSGCQGQNLQRSKQIIENAWFLGFSIAQEFDRTGDFNRVINRLMDISNQLNAAAQELPYSCQTLIKQWSNAVANAYQSPSGTQCMGGVCCDSTGCY